MTIRVTMTCAQNNWKFEKMKYVPTGIGDRFARATGGVACGGDDVWDNCVLGQLAQKLTFGPPTT